MKILQVTSSSYTMGRGESEYVRNISERLARRHEVTVFATDSHGKLPKHEIINGVKVERFRSFAPDETFNFSWELLLRLRKTQTDVLHGHNYHSFPFHVAHLARHKKLLVSPLFHGAGHTSLTDSLLKLFKLFIRSRTLKKADLVLAASEHEKLLLLQHFGLEADKVTVIPRGVDLSEFTNLERQKTSSKSVLYVGRLVAYKGVQYLVEALPKLPSGVILEIVGKGPLKKTLVERAKKLNVLDRIRFSQDLERRDLLQMYVNADVFALPSRYEAYSKVVAEALTAGTPCIVADISALKEWVDNESCFGVKFPINIDELSDLLERVLEANIDSHRMKKWIGTKIIDWNEVVAKLEAIYDQ